ncbi:RNA helicase [Malassezia cuniculi]|uniref:RNA helicase n=1 Tax=Malassezia cuniculi TaxID=948313 RepID=A0AAF0ER50_9BASI|nr:RNA helicase [Malassezia cuniculi]
MSTAHGRDASEYAEADKDYVPYVPLKKRRTAELERLRQRSRRPVGWDLAEMGADEARQEGGAAEGSGHGAPAGPVHASGVVLTADAKNREEREADEDARIAAAHASRRKLHSDAELARGIVYTEPMKRSWTAPRYVLRRSASQNEALRRRYRVSVEGDSIPPIITDFADMKLPGCVVAHLAAHGITRPSAIQMQGLPAAFAGRDVIGVASTGSGKTLAFSLPLVMYAIEAETRLPYVSGDGPVGVILCPSRELARQTYDGIVALVESIGRGGYPSIRTLLCIGGISMSEQSDVLKDGVHLVVATPGRLQEMLDKGRFGLESCTFLCLDEADRMIDLGFEDEVRHIMSFFERQRQTLLFSATMPQRIRDFATGSLVKPVVIHVGRAGAASLDVVQEVELVDVDGRSAQLLDALQKTAPPVIIFCDAKHEVDGVCDFLVSKGVAAAAIHGSKSQEERERAISSFKHGDSDVLVASAVASKGLDFRGIKHVINYSMPRDIEDYVHQIGRTGRSGRTGIATTFVGASTPIETLTDLKCLLVEARQRYVFANKHPVIPRGTRAPIS